MTLTRLKKNREWLVIALFSCWAILTSLALFYFGNQNYGAFAANDDWHSISEQSISPLSLGLPLQPGFQIVHVRQQGCICNRRADQFKTFLLREYNVNKYKQYDIDISQLAAAGISLPASPAVLIFQQGQLIYAGPYASGPLCSVDESLITPILQEKITFPGLWLNGESKSCRCLNEIF